jgi:hypothetical protein
MGTKRAKLYGSIIMLVVGSAATLAVRADSVPEPGVPGELCQCPNNDKPGVLGTGINPPGLLQDTCTVSNGTLSITGPAPGGGSGSSGCGSSFSCEVEKVTGDTVYPSYSTLPNLTCQGVNSKDITWQYLYFDEDPNGNPVQVCTASLQWPCPCPLWIIPCDYIVCNESPYHGTLDKGQSWYAVGDQCNIVPAQ